MKLQKPFFGTTFIWTILRKLLPEDMTNEIRGMRSYADMTGVVFDVPDTKIERFEDVFSHLKEENRIDFEISRSKSLPELKEDGSASYGSYGGGGAPSYGGASEGGYGGRGGSSSYGNGGR